jgi:hypothetical protein
VSATRRTCGFGATFVLSRGTAAAVDVPVSCLRLVPFASAAGRARTAPRERPRRRATSRGRGTGARLCGGARWQEVRVRSSSG